MTDLKHLKQLAMAATPGRRWIECGVSQHTGWAICTGHNETHRDILFLDGTRNCELDEKTNNVEEDQDFIAALNPQTVLAMIEEIEAARAMRDELKPTTIFGIHNPPGFSWKKDGVDLFATNLKDNTYETVTKIMKVINAFDEVRKRNEGEL